MAPVALLFLLALAAQGSGAFGTRDETTDLLLVAAGLITVIPLLMFLEAGRRLPLSTVGLIQYLTPTLQFLLAVVIYREDFTAIHLAAFGCIWLALVLYTADAWLHQRRRGVPGFTSAGAGFGSVRLFRCGANGHRHEATHQENPVRHSRIADSDRHPFRCGNRQLGRCWTPKAFDVGLQRLLAIGLLIAIILFAGLFHSVSRPLHLISRGLHEQDPRILDSLASEPTEFGELARLIDDFYQQRQHLNAEIQERRQTERQLRLFSSAIEQSANLVMITDQKGTIEYVNPKFVQVTGYTEAEVIGANPRILRSGRTPREHYEHLWRTITAGGEWRGELHNRRKDGTLFWESTSIAPLRDEAGIITHFVAIKEDIPHRKRIEAALHASELKYRNVFATIGDALFLIDNRDGRILTVNPAACKLYGYSRKELLALKDIDLAASPTIDAELPRTESRRLTDRSSRRLTDRSHRSKNGTVFPVDIWVRHFSYKGHTITVAAIRDIRHKRSRSEKSSV